MAASGSSAVMPVPPRVWRYGNRSRTGNGLTGLKSDVEQLGHDEKLSDQRATQGTKHHVSDQDNRHCRRVYWRLCNVPDAVMRARLEFPPADQGNKVAAAVRTSACLLDEMTTGIGRAP